jgi:glyoxalase family protein
MTESMHGIHHITAIAGDPQRNLDFYTQVLGLRLVKLTVNFDDPGTYHFYFGDAAGHPGTILTFFPWQNVRRGRHGVGQVGVVSFSIPLNSVGFWSERLKKLGVSVSAPMRRFDDEVLGFVDPDGLRLDLVGNAADSEQAEPWAGSPIPLEHSLRGFAAPTLLLAGFEQTSQLLQDSLGMTPPRGEGQRYRFAAGSGAGGQVDIDVRPNEPAGGMGAGIVHHIAFRAAGEEQQLAMRAALIDRGVDVTPVLDRQYFRSIYFREPGGVLFEIATDPPGFMTDETAQGLGASLKLPPWLETNRAQIENALPPLKLPEGQPRQAG